MTDEDFAKRLAALDAQGKDGIPAMRELLRPAGQLSRLIALAVRGAQRAKRSGEKTTKTEIGDYKPGKDARAAAVAYWAKRDRSELAAGIDDEISQFSAHHKKNADKMADWDAAWQTWYANAVRFNKKIGPVAPLGSRPPSSVSDESWRGRARVWFGVANETEAPGRWGASWGAKPGEPGCMCPPHILASVDAERTPAGRRAMGRPHA